MKTRVILLVMGLLSFIAALIFGVIFVYNYPHFPITLDSANSCQVYKVKSLSTLTGEWESSGTHPLGSKPALNQYSLRGQIDQYVWIDRGPFPCSKTVRVIIKNILHDPLMYKKLDNRANIYEPNYAYKLTDASGYLLIFIDDTQSWFEVKKYNKCGKIIEDSGVVQCPANSDVGYGWRKVICQNFLNENK